MRTRHAAVVAATLLLTAGGAAFARQATVDVPWGDQVLEVDPALCHIQGVVSGFHSDQKLGQEEARVLVDVAVLVPTEDGGYALAADTKGIPATEEWAGVELGDELCLVPVEGE